MHRDLGCQAVTHHGCPPAHIVCSGAPLWRSSLPERVPGEDAASCLAAVLQNYFAPRHLGAAQCGATQQDKDRLAAHLNQVREVGFVWSDSVWRE